MIRLLIVFALIILGGCSLSGGISIMVDNYKEWTLANNTVTEKTYLEYEGLIYQEILIEEIGGIMK